MAVNAAINVEYINRD